MKNIILKIATLATLLVGLLFTACNKEEIAQPEEMQAKHRVKVSKYC